MFFNLSTTPINEDKSLPPETLELFLVKLSACNLFPSFFDTASSILFNVFSIELVLLIILLSYLFPDLPVIFDKVPFFCISSSFFVNCLTDSTRPSVPTIASRISFTSFCILGEFSAIL